MTNQEAIETIKHAITEVEWMYPMDYAAAFDKAIEALGKQEPGWISVKDRLPEGKTNPLTLDFNEVICFCDFGGDPKRTDVRTYKFGTRLGDTRPHFWHGPQIMDGVVTHWQYLPEPPKEAKQDDP